MPDYDMVVAITSGLKDMQIPLNLLWDHLLPGICDAKLPESAVSQELMNKLNTLKVLLPKGDKISEMAEEIAGKCFTWMIMKIILNQSLLHLMKMSYIYILPPG